MALDTVGRQYADKLFHQRMEEILKEQTSDVVKVRQDHAARNMTMSGNYFTAQAQVYVRYAELLAQARVDSLLDAYKKSGTPIDDAAFAAIETEVAQYCEAQSRNIVQALTNGIGQTFGNQGPGGFREAISGQVVSQIGGVSARVRRKLSILQDEAKLAARNAAASRTSAQTDMGKSTPNDRNGATAAPKPVPHAKPHLYYWRFLLEFGQECYRTWRWELLASLVVAFVTYMITAGDDPLAWRNFQIALVATAIALAGFALWHLLRTPWLVHRGSQSAEESTPHWALGIVGIAVLCALIVGAFLSVDRLHQVPPPLVKFAAPPPPVLPAPQPQQKPDSKKQSNMMIPHAPPAQPDRILTDQQGDHLYQKLKEFASDPKYADLISVTIAPYANQDLESAHVTYQLTRIFQDAHWKVLRQTQSPIQLVGSAQHQIPIGIWILTSRDQNYGYFLWSALKEVGLDSQVRPKSDLPTDFAGTIIWIGYKEAPVY
jgi:hypothetical protein